MDERPFPTAALVGAGILILSSVIGVGTIQLMKHFGLAEAGNTFAQASVEEERELRFVDQNDGVNAFGGHVRVFDVATGAELPQLSDTDGFVRAVLNGLAFQRSKASVTAPPVFTLTRWSDKRITLSDKATGARINLADFGFGNKSVFLRFFESSGIES